MTDEVIYARTWRCEEERAAAVGVWNIHYNYHRPHTAVGNQTPAARLRTAVTNVMAGNTARMAAH